MFRGGVTVTVEQIMYREEAIMKKSISNAALRRMTSYLAYLKSLSGHLPQYVSAPVIANALQLGEVQVRKDLAKIARPGHTKIGRNTMELIHDIEKSIGLEQPMRAVLVGSADFLPWLMTQCGENICVLGHFTENLSIGENNALPMSQLVGFCRKMCIQIGILNVSSDMLYPAAELLEKGGVYAIWNFSPVPMAVQGNILIQNENLLPSLGVFSYYATESICSQKKTS